MAGFKVQLTLQQSNQYPSHNIILLSSILLKKLKIPANQSINLRFGSWKSNIQFISDPKQKGFQISPFLAQQWSLRDGMHVQMQHHVKSNTVVIGPLIGVLVSKVLKSDPDKPFGTLTTFSKELISASNQYGAVIYFFTPDDIKNPASSLHAWTYDGAWKKQTFPIPNVVYNRLTSRKYENNPSVQQFMKEVKSQYNTQIFNEKYLDKTDVFKALGSDPSVQSYLPESYLFRNFSMLKNMCRKYPIVFLKPITGSLGKGIIRITRVSSSSYICHFSTVNGVRTQTFPALSKVFLTISGRLKQQKYQIQQGIHLIQVGDHPVDFRALVQKNRFGRWIITSIVARIAGKEHFVSNLARGGSLSTIKEVLPRSNLAPSLRETISKGLRVAAKEIAESVEKNIPYHFGELGVDLAVDKNGRIWLIEVNSKPSKNDNTALTSNKIRPSVKHIIQYSQYLAGF